MKSEVEHFTNHACEISSLHERLKQSCFIIMDVSWKYFLVIMEDNKNMSKTTKF